MSQTGDTAVVIPARDECDRIHATVMSAAALPGADLVIVVDDGSRDGTADVAEAAGAHVVRHGRSRGKGAAMETGAEAVRLLDAVERRSTQRHLLFLDADLAETACNAYPLIEPVRAGTADMTIAMFANRVKLGGHGFVVRLSGRGHPAGDRLAANPAAQWPAMPDQGGVRDRRGRSPGDSVRRPRSPSICCAAACG